MARIRKHLKIAKVKTKMGHPIIFCYQHRVWAFSRIHAHRVLYLWHVLPSTTLIRDVLFGYNPRHH